jgi:dTDP-4-dehydrorhamnose reductase
VRIAVVGAAGQLGSDLVRVWGDDAFAVTHQQMDVTNADAVLRVLTDAKPDAILNTAAFVQVDACEADAAIEAWRVNALGAANVARAAQALHARLVYYSTNYVFAGDKPTPYTEDDAPAPQSMYAISKLAGEFATSAYCAAALIVRTSGLYGRASNHSKGGNFVERILALARRGESLRVVDDQLLTPTSTRDLAHATRQAIATDASGVMHLTNGDSCSWHAFAVEALRVAGIDAGVEAVATTPGPGIAARPKNGVLVSQRRDAPTLRPWREALAEYLSDAADSR